LYVDKKSKIQGTTGNNNGLRPWPLAAQLPGGRGAYCIAGGGRLRMILGTSRPPGIEILVENHACVWRIATGADITGNSRRERQMPLPS
jgi:hypothetical protein